MMCFHLLRPYKAPEKHPPCCFNVWACARVCACQSFCFPACTDMGHLLKKSVWLMTGTTPKTKIQKTNEGSKRGECSHCHQTLHFPRNKGRIWTVFPQAALWMNPGSQHLPYINSMKTGLAISHSVIYWSNEWPRSGSKNALEYNVAIHASSSRRSGSRANFLPSRSWRRLPKLNMGFIRRNKYHYNVRLEHSLLLVQQALL